MSYQEMPIFTRTFDLLSWLLQLSNHFPRAQRHTVTQRMLGAAFDLRERLEEANLRRGAARLERLQRADECLARLRLYVRLAARWDWISAGQYQHGAKMLDEIGRLLGGWIKVSRPKQTGN
jgi:hypothetical protein